MIFLLALALWAVLFFLVLVFNHGAHLNDEEFEDQQRERLGISDFDQWAAERDERVRRAEFRHATRWGGSV